VITIRNDQIKLFEQAADEAFETRTYAHLEKWFPRHCQLVGEEQMRQVIRLGWQRAKSYELTAECCVRSYIESMCLLGSGFDRDSLLPWASEILNDTSSSDQVARGDKLYYKMWDYIDHIAADYRDQAGRPTTARFMRDLKELRHEDPEAPALSIPDRVSSIHAKLTRLFPAKCAYVGDPIVRSAIAGAVQSAAGYGVTSTNGATFFVSLRFVLGHGFDRDPLLPWVSATLGDPALQDPVRKAEKLYAQGIAFLNRWWQSSFPEDRTDVLG
jgi:hypothetical protein